MTGVLLNYFLYNYYQMKAYLFKLFIIISFLIIPAVSSFADAPDAPPAPDPGGTGGGTPVGGPIDGGMTILLVLGAVYGAKKIYTNAKKEKHQPPAE